MVNGSLAVKDLRLALQLAAESETKLPLAKRALREYERALDQGWGDQSCHSVIRLAEERSGVTLRSLLPDQESGDEDALG